MSPRNFTPLRCRVERPRAWSRVALVFAAALAASCGDDGVPREQAPDERSGTGPAEIALDPCLAVACGEHGRCVEEEGRTGCVCEDGYAGEFCARCASGYQRVGTGCLAAESTSPPEPCCGDGIVDTMAGEESSAITETTASLDPAEDSISTAASRTEQSSSTPLDEGEVTDVITSAETNVTTFAPPDAGLSGESSETTPSHASTASVPDAGEAWPSCAFTLTHSSEPGRIDARASVACLGGEGHEDSGYLRTFDLAAFGITHFRVTELRVGVEAAYAGPEQAGVQTVISRIYSTASDPPAAASLMLLESRAFDVADTQRSTIAIPMTAAMDATSGPYLVAEVFTPRLNGNRFFLGANAASESDESYLRAPACSVPDFAAIDDLGIASDMHLLIHLHGIATGPVCAPE